MRISSNVLAGVLKTISRYLPTIVVVSLAQPHHPAWPVETAREMCPERHPRCPTALVAAASGWPAHAAAAGDTTSDYCYAASAHNAPALSVVPRPQQPPPASLPLRWVLS